MDENLRAVLGVAPPVSYLTEKQFAFVIGRTLSTVRNWRFAYPPATFKPPAHNRLPNGRIVYPAAAVVEFVQQTGMLNPLVLAQRKAHQ